MAARTKQEDSRSRRAIAPRKRPRQKRSSDLVGAILEAAIRVLSREGARAFTTIRVAREAGVSVGSLYQYFPNKQALLFRLQTDEWDETWSVCEDILGDTQYAPAERLRRMIRAFFRSERQERLLRAALDEDAIAFRQTPEAVELEARVRRSTDVFFAAFLPDAPPARRAFAADFVMTSLGAVAEEITGQGRSLTEIDAWAEASADLYLGWLERLSDTSAAAPADRPT